MPRTGSCPHGSIRHATSLLLGHLRRLRYGPACNRAAWPYGCSPAKARRSTPRSGPGPLKRSWRGHENLLRRRKSFFGPPPEPQHPALRFRARPTAALRRRRPTPETAPLLPSRLSQWQAGAAAWQWTWPRTPSSWTVSRSASRRWNTASSDIWYKTSHGPSHVKNCNASWSHLTVPARHSAPSTCMLDASGASWAQPAMSSPQCVEAATNSCPDQAAQSADPRNTASRQPVTPID